MSPICPPDFNQGGYTMAINIRCLCGGETKLTAKRCPRCEKPFPNKGKRYKVVVRANGQKFSRTVKNLELARDIESKLQVDISRDEFDIKKKTPAPTLNKVWDKFLPWAKSNKKTWHSDYCNFEKHLKPIFGSKPLDTITPFDIEKLIISMKKGTSKNEKPYALATIKHQIVLLSRLYNIAEQWGMYSGPNPCNKVKRPKLNNQKTEFLSNDELTRLLEVLANWHDKMSVAFIKFAMYSGLRRGEQFKLTWDDIDFERKSVILRDPKGVLDQTIPLSKEALHVLKEIPRKYDTPYIFHGKNGEQRTNFKGPWQRIKEEAKLPNDFRFHGLRHNFASTLVSNGVPLYTVQKLLCHKDAKTTQRYAHLADHALREAVDLSGQLFIPKKKAEVVKLEAAQNG